MSVMSPIPRGTAFLPEATADQSACWLTWIYIDRAWFEQNDAGGFYLVRGTKSLNPKIIQAWRGDGRKYPSWRDYLWREAGRRRCRAEVLDMVVKSGQVEYQLSAGLLEEKRFCLWMTNLPRAAWSAEQVMSLGIAAAGRWSCYLKSGNRKTGSRVCL